MVACKYLPALMKHRITLQQPIQTPDGQGGFTVTWESLDDLWAQITPIRAYERMQAMQLSDPRTHKLVIRYRAGITANMRFLYGSRIFGIKEILNRAENNIYLDIQVVES